MDTSPEIRGAPIVMLPADADALKAMAAANPSIVRLLTQIPPFTSSGDSLSGQPNGWLAAIKLDGAAPGIWASIDGLIADGFKVAFCDLKTGLYSRRVSDDGTADLRSNRCRTSSSVQAELEAYVKTRHSSFLEKYPLFNC